MKEFFKKNLVGLLSAFFILLIIYFEFFKIFWAFKGHRVKDGIIAVCVPLYAWYLATEYWWHDDFANVN